MDSIHSTAKTTNKQTQTPTNKRKNLPGSLREDWHLCLIILYAYMCRITDNHLVTLTGIKVLKNRHCTSFTFIFALPSNLDTVHDKKYQTNEVTLLMYILIIPSIPPNHQDNTILTIPFCYIASGWHIWGAYERH